MSLVAKRVVMVRPAAVWSNPETSVSNSFQKPDLAGVEEITRLVWEEFDGVVQALREVGVEVLVWQSENPTTPDALFPNNWLVTLPSAVFVCPMATPSRAAEVDWKLVELVSEGRPVHDLTGMAPLEGTGSLVFDHSARLAYACLSPRTHESTARFLCDLAGYELVAFSSLDQAGSPVYHTNVIASVGPTATFAAPGFPGEVAVPLSWEQICGFAGNCLELTNPLSETILVRSKAVSLPSLPRYDHVVEVGIPMIEHHGGGSVRCLLAEWF